MEITHSPALMHTCSCSTTDAPSIVPDRQRGRTISRAPLTLELCPPAHLARNCRSPSYLTPCAACNLTSVVSCGKPWGEPLTPPPQLHHMSRTSPRISRSLLTRHSSRAQTARPHTVAVHHQATLCPLTTIKALTATPPQRFPEHPHRHTPVTDNYRTIHHLLATAMPLSTTRIYVATLYPISFLHGAFPDCMWSFTRALSFLG